jgi:hypothetical protein
VQNASVEVAWLIAKLAIMPPAPMTAATSKSATKNQRLIVIVMPPNGQVFDERDVGDELPNCWSLSLGHAGMAVLVTPLRIIKDVY